MAHGTGYVHGYEARERDRLNDQASTLVDLRNLLRRGGTITVIEGDHGSAYFHPDSAALHRSAADDGVFCYTFFKAVATTPCD